MMRRALLAAGFALLAAGFALCGVLHAEHRNGVLEFRAEEPLAERLSRAAPGPAGDRARHRLGTSLVRIPVEEGIPVRVAATWGLRPDLDCDHERVRADLSRVGAALDDLRVVWRAESGGVERVVREQRLAGAPPDGPAGWSRLPPPFVWDGGGDDETLGGVLAAEAGFAGPAAPECWFFVAAGRRTMALRGRDLAALLVAPLGLLLLLAGMWRRRAAPGGEGGATPLWRWGDALAPVALFGAFQALGTLVSWGSDDMATRLLEQAPVVAALGLGAALVAARRRTQAPLAALGGRPSGSPVWIAAGFAAGAALAFPAARVTGALLPADVSAALLWVPGNVLAFATASTVAALSEEALWRGLVWEVAAPRLGTRWTVVATAALFTLSHVAARERHLWALGIIAVLAAALGLLRARTGSLVPCVALHAAYNLTLVTLGYFAAA